MPLTLITGCARRDDSATLDVNAHRYFLANVSVHR